MEYRTLNINVISAEGLKDVKRFSKMDLYAEISLAGYPQSKQRTFVHKNCGTDPKWNHRLDFVVDEPYLTKPGLSLLFQIKHDSTFGTDKEIGSVTVPIDELFKPDSFSDERTVDYKVITADGKPKGTLKFSFRFGEKFSNDAKRGIDEPPVAYPAPAPYAAPAPPQAPYASGSGYGGHPGMGYPPSGPPAAEGYGYGAYPPAGGAYGYQAPPPAAYGYPPAGYPPQYAQAAQKPKKKNKMGMGGGLGLGLGAGLLGGLLVGEMASDIGEMGAYADGYGDAMGDMGDFDF